MQIPGYYDKRAHAHSVDFNNNSDRVLALSLDICRITRDSERSVRKIHSATDFIPKSRAI